MAIHFQVVAVCSLIGLSAIVSHGSPLQDGRISDVVRDVRVTEPGNRSMAVTGEALLREGTIQTGPESRAQVSFHDRTLVRISDNTQLGFQSKARSFELIAGAILTEVPSGAGRTSIRVRGITATATGTTLVIECLPQAYTKFISLDGTSRLCMGHAPWAQDCVLLRAGQMLIAGPDPKSLPDAVDVDLGHLLETCQFITEFPELPAHDRLAKAAAAQRNRKTHGQFAETNLVIFGRGTLVSQRNSSPAANKEHGGSPAPPAPSPKE